MFGIAGFGTALISAPLLAHAVPIGRLIPVLALLDFVAAVTNVIKDRHKADYREVSLLIPCMVMGSLAGAWLLLRAPTPLYCCWRWAFSPSRTASMPCRVISRRG